MKKRLVAFALFAAITVSFFAYGCNNSANVKKVADLSYMFSIKREMPEVAEPEGFSGYTYETGDDYGALIFKKTETVISGGKAVTVTYRRAYNARTGAAFDLPEARADISEGTGSFVSCDFCCYLKQPSELRSYSAIAVTIKKISLKNGALDTETALCVFDATGNKITEFSAEEYAKEVAYNGSVELRGGTTYFLAGDRAFLAQDNGALTEFKEYDPRIGIFDVVCTGGIKVERTSNSIIAYNDDYSVKSVYNLPDTAVKTFVRFLTDGTAFVQYLTVAGAETNDYDFITDGIKYKLTTGKLHLDDNAFKKKSATFVAYGIANATEYSAVNVNVPEGADNVIFYYPIKDKKIDTGNAVIAEMDNDFNLKRRFNGFANSSELPVAIGNDRYAVESERDNSYYVLDNGGNIVASESLVIMKDVKTNGKFFICGENVYYIKDGKFVKSEFAERGDKFMFAGDGVIAKRTENGETGYYLITETDCADTGAYHAVENGDWHYLCKKNAANPSTDADYEVYKKDGTMVLSFTAKNGQNEKARISLHYDTGAFLVGYLTETGYKQFIYNADGKVLAEADEINIVRGCMNYALFSYKNGEKEGFFAVKRGERV